MSPPYPRTLLVLGSQRSGTTLLGQILGAHPAAFLIDEEDGWQRRLLLELRGAARGPRWLARRTSFRRARTKYRRPAERCDRWGGLHRQVRFLVLKAPNLTYHARQLAERFPDCAAVFLLRDLRDVVASMRDLRGLAMVERQVALAHGAGGLGGGVRGMLERAASSQTAAHVRLALIARLKIELADDFERAGIETARVRYEDLVRAPHATVSALSSELSMPFEPVQLVHEQVLIGRGPGGTERSRPIDGASVGRWRARLTTVEAADVWSVFEPLAARFGYSRATDGLAEQPVIEAERRESLGHRVVDPGPVEPPESSV